MHLTLIISRYIMTSPSGNIPILYPIISILLSIIPSHSCALSPNTGPGTTLPNSTMFAKIHPPICNATTTHPPDYFSSTDDPGYGLISEASARRTNRTSLAILNIRTQLRLGSALRLYIVLVQLMGTVKNFSFDDSDAIRFPHINPMSCVSMIEWQIRNFFTDPCILLHHFTFHYYSSTESVIKEL